jgi:hypothetical protein
LPGEPTAWNVVVVGAWNVAILTPDGIRRRLFKLPDTTVLDVEVSVDRPGPYRVLHDGLVVVPTSRLLEVGVQTPTQAFLENASKVAQAALDALPHTPVFAAGVNIRYRYDDVPSDVLDLVRAPIDDALSDADFAILGSVSKRTLSLGKGALNVELATSGGGTEGSLLLNFHRDSTEAAELADWLARIGEFVDVARKMSAVLKAQIDL